MSEKEAPEAGRPQETQSLEKNTHSADSLVDSHFTATQESEMTGESTLPVDSVPDKQNAKKEDEIQQRGFDRATVLARYAELDRARKSLNSCVQNIEFLCDSGVFHQPNSRSSQSAKDLDTRKENDPLTKSSGVAKSETTVEMDSARAKKLKTEAELIKSEPLDTSQKSDLGNTENGSADLRQGGAVSRSMAGKDGTAVEDDNVIVTLPSVDDSSKPNRSGARKKRVSKWRRTPPPHDSKKLHQRKNSPKRHFHNTRSEHDRLSRVGAASSTKDEIVTIHRTLSSDAILQHCEHSIVTNGNRVRRRNTHLTSDDNKSTTSSKTDGNHSDSYDTCDTCDEDDNGDLSDSSSVSTYTDRMMQMQTDDNFMELDSSSHIHNIVMRELREAVLNQELDHMETPSGTENEAQQLYNVGERTFALCEICFDWRELNLRFCCNFPACDDCVSQYFITQVNQGIVKIECLNPACTQNAHKNEILARFLHLPEMQEKFHRFLVEANKDAHIKTCPRCSQVCKINQSLLKSQTYRKKGHQVTCMECKLIWCFPCQAPWHDGLMCAEYRRGDKLLRRWAKEHHYGQANAQKCPRCKVYIQRSTGCDHMQCARCKTSFCYRCGDRYREVKFLGDHFSKFSIFGCKYRFKPDQPVQRKLIRGAVFSGQLMAAPIVGALAVAMGVVMLGISVVILPCYGGVKIHKKLEARKEIKRRRQAAAEWRAKLESVRKTDRRFLYDRPAMFGGQDMANIHRYMDLVHGYKVSNIASGSASSSTTSCSSEDDGQVKVTEVKVITEAPPSDMKVTDDESPPDNTDTSNHCDKIDEVNVKEIIVSCGSVELHTNPTSDHSSQDGAAGVTSATTAANSFVNSDIHMCHSRKNRISRSKSVDASSPSHCGQSCDNECQCQKMGGNVARGDGKVDCEDGLFLKAKKHSSMEELYKPEAESVRAQSDICWYFTV